MAARFQYECPECQSAIELSTTQAGQELSCSNCNAEITAPKLGVIKSLPRVDDGEAPVKKKGRSEKSGSALKSWLFAGGLLLAVLAGAAGWAAQSRANDFYVDVDIEKIVESEFKAIDEAPASDIYQILAGASQDSFTLEYSEAPYRTLNIKSGIFQWVAWACYGVAGLGLLMLLSSFFVKGSAKF